MVSGRSEAPARGLHSTRKATPPGIGSTPTGVLPKGNACRSPEHLQSGAKCSAIPVPNRSLDLSCSVEIRWASRFAWRGRRSRTECSSLFTLREIASNRKTSHVKSGLQGQKQKAKEILWKTWTGDIRWNRARQKTSEVPQCWTGHPKPSQAGNLRGRGLRYT
jgi:hypothetical protein